MTNDAFYKSIMLFNNALEQLKSCCEQSLNTGFKIMATNNLMGDLTPYIDSLAAYCNEHLDGNIRIADSAPLDLMKKSRYNRNRISDINSILSTRFPNADCKFDFSSKADMNSFELFLQDVKQSPPVQQTISDYFIKGYLEALRGVYAYQAVGYEMKLLQKINRNEVGEQIERCLLDNGVMLDEEHCDALFNAVSQGSCGLLYNSKRATTSDLLKEIKNNIAENFGVKESVLDVALLTQSEALLEMIEPLRAKWSKNKLAGRNVAVVLMQVPQGENEYDKVQQCIYLDKISDDINANTYEWTDRKNLPEYLKPYANDNEIKQIAQQWQQWEEYEQNRVDSEEVRNLMSDVSMNWMLDVNDDCEVALDVLETMEQDLLDGDGIDDEESQQSVGVLAQHLLLAAQACEQYANIKIDTHGVNNQTLDNIINKEDWNLTDIRLLHDFVQDVNSQVDERADILHAANVPHYDTVIETILNLPHGETKLRALTCLDMVLDYQVLQAYSSKRICLDKIKDTLECHNQGVDGMLDDFLDIGKASYADLIHKNTSSLSQQVKDGVLEAYVLPLYNREDMNGAMLDIAMLEVRDFDELSEQSQNFLKNLTEFYAQKLVQVHTARLDKGMVDDNLKGCLHKYNEKNEHMLGYVLLSDVIDTSLQQEKEIHQSYLQFKKRKSRYELPKNIDLMMASRWRKAQRQ